MAQCGSGLCTKMVVGAGLHTSVGKVGSQGTIRTSVARLADQWTLFQWGSKVSTNWSNAWKHACYCAFIYTFTEKHVCFHVISLTFDPTGKGSIGSLCSFPDLPPAGRLGTKLINWYPQWLKLYYFCCHGRVRYDNLSKNILFQTAIWSSPAASMQKS